MIIKSLVPAVISKLRNNSQYTSVVPYYIAIAILDLTQNFEFEDLKTTGPLTNFIVNQAEYTVKNNQFINPEDYKLTFINAWFVYFSTSGVVTLGQSTGKEIDKRDLRVVEPMSKIPGIPSFYTIQGSDKNNGKIIVGMMPDNPYPCQMRYQRQHPFSIPFEYLIQAQSDIDMANKLATSVVYMPDDWTDIVVYYASEKLCDDIGMNDIGMSYHQKLFGYKDKRGSDVPGLITVKQSEEQRNASFNSRALRPIVRRYT